MSEKKARKEVFLSFRLNYFCLGPMANKLCGGILIFQFMLHTETESASHYFQGWMYVIILQNYLIPDE
jgi:hypothetical protein